MKRNNPSTSHAAYKQVTSEMKESHYAKIVLALERLKTGHYEKIAETCGLEKHAVGRRLSEMEGDMKVWKPGGIAKTSTGRNAFLYQLTSETKVYPAPIEKSLKGKSIPSYTKDILNLAKQSVQQTLF